MAYDPDLKAHLEWLGYLQPVGLVVSPHALLQAQAILNRNILPDHRRFLEHIQSAPTSPGVDAVPLIQDFPAFACSVLGWEPADLLGTPAGGPLPDDLEVALPDYEEVLRPTYAVREFQAPSSDSPRGAGASPADSPSSSRGDFEALQSRDLASAAGGGRATEPPPPYLLLIQILPSGTDLDTHDDGAEAHRWHASPQAKFERLLREKQVPIGLLGNGTHLRLVYAPRGETSGHLTFPVKAMTEVAGRPIFAALHLLLSSERLFSLPARQRLPALLADSRKYQNVVSTKLAGQVLSALYELLRGFQAADDLRHGEVLREVLNGDPNQVYAGLLTVLLRSVFVLYAEDRGLLPADALYRNHYSVSGLFEQLRADAGRHPDTMDQRYGAWARLLTLFRLLHDGAAHGPLRIPARHGHLFDPERYPFLEGRLAGQPLAPGHTLPLVSDGVIYRVLDNLLVLDGERLSYRSLDVEQIGSVYEAMMGFRLEVAKGRAIAVKAKKKHGAPATLDLDALLVLPPFQRGKFLADEAEQALTGQALKALQEAKTPEDAVQALGRKVAAEATPNIVPEGAMVLQPSEERRRSGSHYTPRSLTEPIVRTTLRPILERLGPSPTPDQILGLKVCDMAMGSGAFLVEADRQLGDALVKAWYAHKCLPKVPPDEDEVLHARRLVAQRCLYGVDKNPLAVDLAKLSLWLATLARDHAFTFLDHSLRCGDSLVGLTRRQIAAFHWDPGAQREIVEAQIEEPLKRVADLRKAIQLAEDEADNASLTRLLDECDNALADVRLIGDLAIAAFFTGKNDRERKAKREEYLEELAAYWDTKDPDHLVILKQLRGEALEGSLPIPPFHWEVEFPEVFEKENPGFHTIVGNPPFMGGPKICVAYGNEYRDWLLMIHEESHGNADLVAHFFRNGFHLLGIGGCFGLIATNTIGQGDTRSTGLRWICKHHGSIFSAKKRCDWPGEAAVKVSVVHVISSAFIDLPDLNGKQVSKITAYLFQAGDSEDPYQLEENKNKAFKGSDIYGMGFTFDDEDKTGTATPISEMRRLLSLNPNNAEVIFKLLGGEEVNESPIHANKRYIIYFGEMEEKQARRWQDLFAILEQKVKPERDSLRTSPSAESRKKYWWRFSRPTTALYTTIRVLNRVLVCSRHQPNWCCTFVPSDIIFSDALVVFAFQDPHGFSVMQSRIHEVWIRFFGSSMKDDMRYTPSDCFGTFPFPKGTRTTPTLEVIGCEYYDFRASLMVANNEGLTKTYNRFHDPEHDGTGVEGRAPSEVVRDIQRLRDLHDAMDRAVLDAYGWTDIRPTCQFLLDYEEEEDEEETGRRRKKPWRYRWPDDIRDEVLARLLALNAQRAEEERLHALQKAADSPAAYFKPRRGKKAKEPTTRLPMDSE